MVAVANISCSRGSICSACFGSISLAPNKRRFSLVIVVYIIVAVVYVVFVVH